MTKAEDQTSQAKTLHQSGFTAFQNKAYKESIDYFKRAQALGLNLIDDAEANRFIGLAYWELRKGGLARKYLRQATASGMFSGNSILALANAEGKRSSVYKWIRGDYHQEKVEELLDWFLLSHLPDQDRLMIVASNAFENKKWYKAITLFEDLKSLDTSNVHYQTSYILSCFKSGDLFRAYVDIEDLFSNSQNPLDGLLAIRAEISMILGKFKEAKEYYSLVAEKDGEDLKSILQNLDVYIRADEVSEEFQQKAMLHFMKGYYSTSYINSIDNMDHFELMLNAVSNYREYFHTEQKKKTQELLGSTSNHFNIALDLFKNSPIANISESPKPDERLAPFERMEKQQKSDREAVRELKKLNPVMNTSMIVSFTEQFDRQITRSGLFLKTRLFLYKLLLLLFRVLLFFIPAAVFIDGLYGAITGNNLLSVFFPYILSATVPGGFQILTAVLWFLLLVFVDSVLMSKMNRAIVSNLREALVDYTSLNTYMLVSGEAAYEFLNASQPMPHLEMDINQLMEIGLNAKKPWEIRQGALFMAETKATGDDLLAYIEPLKTLMNLGDKNLSFGAARLLAIAKYTEALPVIESELKGNNHAKTDDTTAINQALQALAKFDDASSLAILKEFAVRNLDDPMKLVGCVQAIKILPLELSISTIIELLEACMGEKSEFHTFLEVLNGLGDPVVNPLVAFYNKHHEELYGFDGYEVLLAVLNSESKIGSDVVKKWLVGSEPSQTEKVYDMTDMRYEFFIGRKKFNLISDIAFDENLSVNVRKKAAYYIAYLEKEKLQDVVFRLWQSDELSEVYVKTLGDVGTPACAEKLSAFLEKSRDTIDDTVGKTEYSYVYSALALCGEAGKDKLSFLVNNAESLKVERLFALAALYGINQSDFASLRKLKKSLFDKDINEYHRSHVFWVMEWCIQREDDIEFKLHQHRKPSPIKYYQFLKWASQNSKLPEQVHVMAEFALSSSSFKEYDRELHLPKSYNKIEIYWEKIKSKISDKKK